MKTAEAEGFRPAAGRAGRCAALADSRSVSPTPFPARPASMGFYYGHN